MQCGIKIRKTHRTEEFFIQTVWIFLSAYQNSFLKSFIKAETRSEVQNVFLIEKLIC
jgi:hypothetical protein